MNRFNKRFNKCDMLIVNYKIGPIKVSHVKSNSLNPNIILNKLLVSWIGTEL